jgi:hypothetical protein
MTDKQIKQNADNYYEHIINDVAQYRFACNCFVAGAHSRDKEVNDLEKALANVNELCHQQRNKIYELRHPWVKADERKPDLRKDANGFTDGISIEVLAKTEKGDYVTAWYSYQIDTWFMCLGEIAGESVLPYKVVEWMKIPK